MKINIDLINTWKGRQFVAFNLSLFRTNKDWTLTVLFVGVGFIMQYNAK